MNTLKKGSDGSLWAYSDSGNDWVQITQEKTKGKFYAESALKSKLGEISARYISNLIRTPDIVSQKLNEVITPEDTIVDEINKSTNKDQAKLSIMQSPIKDLLAVGIAENEINTVRKVWDEQTKAAVRIVVKMDVIKDEIKTLQDEVNKLELEKLNGDDSLKTENRIKELEQEIEGKKVILEQEENNLHDINKTKDDVENKIEEMGLVAILKSNKSIKEKIEAIFKLKGFTLAAVIASITMLFSTMGLSISNALSGSSGGSKPDPKPDPKPKPDPSITDKIKEGLKKFAEWLKYLAGKSAAALPGIIGSIVSFLIKTIGNVVGFMAENIIIFIIIVVSSIIYRLVEGVKEIRKSRN